MWEGFYSIIRLGVYELLKVYFGVIDFVYILLWKKICVGVILGWLQIDIEREFKLNVFCIVSYGGMEKKFYLVIFLKEGMVFLLKFFLFDDYYF